MSLFVESEGLLGTHVSWKDVESAMQKALKTTARFGSEKKVTNIGDQKGMFSRVGLIEAAWEGAGKEESLPSLFVVKMPSQLPMVEASQKMGISGNDEEGGKEKMAGMGQVLRAFHNREVDVYALLTREAHPAIPFTKVYASSKFDEKNQLKGYLITEFFPNIHPHTVIDSVSAQEITPVLKSIAAFSAIGEKLSKEELKFTEGPDLWGTVFGQFFDEKVKAQFKGMLGAFVPDQEMAGKLIQLADDYYFNVGILKQFTGLNQFLNIRPVLTHGDVYSPNIFYSKVNGKLEFKGIIDFQTCTMDNPAQDVAKLIVACLDKKDRREKLQELIRIYYEQFTSQIKGTSVPYTLQQLEDSYDLLFPVLAFVVVFAIAAKIMFLTGEDSNQIKAVAMDKILGLLEDIVTTHEKNIKRHPEFYKF